MPKLELIDKFMNLPGILLKDSDMSGSELSQLSGLSPERLEGLANGKIQPTFEDIDDIRLALGLTNEDVSEILDRMG